MLQLSLCFSCRTKLAKAITVAYLCFAFLHYDELKTTFESTCQRRVFHAQFLFARKFFAPDFHMQFFSLAFEIPLCILVDFLLV